MQLGGGALLEELAPLPVAGGCGGVAASTAYSITGKQQKNMYHMFENYGHHADFFTTSFRKPTKKMTTGLDRL